MYYWNGTCLYAAQQPFAYAIPGAKRCIFRVMQEHADVRAWNLYWLSKPDCDFLLSQSDDWFRHYQSLSAEQTRAFYEALDTPVLHEQTLATIISQPPRRAIRLLAQAKLEKTRFYALFGGEKWRFTMMGRLFAVLRGIKRPQRRGQLAQTAATSCVILNFSGQRSA